MTRADQLVILKEHADFFHVIGTFVPLYQKLIINSSKNNQFTF